MLPVAAVEGWQEVGGMGAVHAVPVRRGHGVHLCDRVAKRRPVRQPTVGLDGERGDDGYALRAAARTTPIASAARSS